MHLLLCLKGTSLSSTTLSAFLNPTPPNYFEERNKPLITDRIECMQNSSNAKLYSSLVWILSGCLLLVYGGLGLMNGNVPGIEELVAFINSATGKWLYLAAFLAIFIEGLYVIGSFFPGSTMVLLIAILAQTGGPLQFAGVILMIYLGWILAGIINILGAKYFTKATRIDTKSIEKIEDNAGLTWFPAFRANTEVAEITEGHSVKDVFLSTLRVKTYASLGAAVYAFIIPFLLDIENRSNEEGFASLSIIAIISFGVGGYKLYQHRQQKTAL
jgi:hypothetical protein